MTPRKGLPSLTVFSPHPDDAVFSLGIALFRWASAAVRIRIINIFTITSYAPRIPRTEQISVTEIRKREDVRALRTISPGIRVISCDCLDAPLRLGIDVGSVCKQQEGLSHEREVYDIWRRINSYMTKGLMLAPLGLGDHVDHRLVHEVIASNARKRNIGFYEDLPYAIWTSTKSLTDRVHNVEHVIRTKLKAVTIRMQDAVPRKWKVVNKYHSQIGPEQTTAIARFANRYVRGERIWIPAHSRLWNSFVRR